MDLRATAMNDEALNLSIRKFLKTVGVSSQREIERAVAQALAARRITDKDGPFPVLMTLRCESLGIDVSYEGSVEIGPGPPPG
jgi:hypothetical protein